MDNADIIAENFIIFHPGSKSKNDVIKELSLLLKANNRVSNVKAFMEEVYKRESISSTNTGIGVAIPHGKGPSVLQTSVALCRFQKEILWDDEPVKVVMLLAVVDNEEGTAHLEVIAKISTLLMDDDFLEILFTVPSEKKLFQEIINRLEEAI